MRELFRRYILETIPVLFRNNSDTAGNTAVYGTALKQEVLAVNIYREYFTLSL
jgi:hypothetical protein